MTRIGDVFEVKTGDDSKKYLQHVADDVTQMSSNVIRTFIREYPLDWNADLELILADQVDFYAHCLTKWGVKDGTWTKVGNSKNVGQSHHQVFFRSSGDYGNPLVKISERWSVWKINEKQKFVGKLEGAFRCSEFGAVLQPANIANRMKTGEYSFVHPGF